MKLHIPVVLISLFVLLTASSCSNRSGASDDPQPTPSAATAAGWDVEDLNPGTQVPCPPGRNCTMHSCPANHAMGGARFDRNDFKCRYVGPIVNSYYETNGHQQLDMLACREGWFMTALHVEGGFLRCGKTRNPLSGATLVRGRQREWAECGGSNSVHAGVMIGYREDRDEMACGGIPRP